MESKQRASKRYAIETVDSSQCKRPCNPTSFPLSDVPADLFEEIFTYISHRDMLCRVEATCTTWRNFSLQGFGWCRFDINQLLGSIRRQDQKFIIDSLGNRIRGEHVRQVHGNIAFIPLFLHLWSGMPYLESIDISFTFLDNVAAEMHLLNATLAESAMTRYLRRLELNIGGRTPPSLTMVIPSSMPYLNYLSLRLLHYPISLQIHLPPMVSSLHLYGDLDFTQFHPFPHSHALTHVDCSLLPRGGHLECRADTPCTNPTFPLSTCIKQFLKCESIRSFGLLPQSCFDAAIHNLQSFPSAKIKMVDLCSIQPWSISPSLPSHITQLWRVIPHVETIILPDSPMRIESWLFNMSHLVSSMSTLRKLTTTVIPHYYWQRMTRKSTDNVCNQHKSMFLRALHQIPSLRYIRILSGHHPSVEIAHFSSLVNFEKQIM